MAQRICDSGEEGRGGSGRSDKVWMDGVKATLSERGWTLEQARATVHDRPVWERLINGA